MKDKDRLKYMKSKFKDDYYKDKGYKECESDELNGNEQTLYVMICCGFLFVMCLLVVSSFS